MDLASLLVLIAFIIAILALVGAFAGNRWGGYSGRACALALVLLSLGVLLGAHGLVHT